MEILKILDEQARELYPEDLEFFETELATGDGYDEAYQIQCRERIQQLRAWMNGDGDNENSSTSKEVKNDMDSSGPMIRIQDLAPKEANPVATSLTSAQLILNDIAMMRNIGSYKTQFKKYVSQKPEIDAAFVDAHCSFFQPWELDAILSVKQMGEEFLEKYFNALDPDKIARYQRFSEDFFIRHFAQMNASIVLEHGKNAWRKKPNRSKQLDVFLRLKGVRI